MKFIPAAVIGIALLFPVSHACAQSTTSEVEAATQRARALHDKGKNREARAIYESLLGKLREAGPSKQLGDVLSGISSIQFGDGDYDGAIRSAQEAAELYRHVSDQNGQAHALNAKGIAEVASGAYPAAEQDLNSALALSLGSGDRKNEVQVRNNLGAADFYQGKYYEAFRSYQDAMAIVNQDSKADWSGYWRQITDFNLATLYQRLGRYEPALEVYRRIQTSSKQLSASDRAHLFSNLGAVYRRLGDPYKALDSYQAALSLYAREHDADGEIGVLKNIGIVYALEQHELERARTMFSKALQLADKTHNRREQMQCHLYLGETFIRTKAIPMAREQFELALAIAGELGTSEEQWKALYGLGRTQEIAGDASDAESSYRKAVGIVEQSRAQLQLSSLKSDFLADKRDVYDALIGLLLDRNDVPEVFSFLERSRARSFQDRLASPERGPAPVTLNEIRSRLQPETMLLETWASADRVAFIWCTRENYGAASRQLSHADQGRLTDLLQKIPSSFERDWKHDLAPLNSLLPLDFATLPSGARHLLVVPDGWLSFVPFELFASSANSKALLIENFDIAYLPSAVLLLRTHAAPQLGLPWTRELAAFGDPVVRSGQIGPDSQLNQFPAPRALPFSAVEVRSVAGMVNGRSELFLGAADRKETFLGGVAGSSVLLHVSTHAYADSDNPENSRLLFSSNVPGGPPEYVFLRELYKLDLSKLDLATISACDTERGKLVRGEGIQAFSRALLSAGSRSSVTTLWRVDDQATAEFMKQFYFFALQERRPPGEALRLAKLKFLRSNTPLQNPRYWAAFVLNGDGLRPLPVFLSWVQVSLAIAVLFVCVVGGSWVLWRRRCLHRRDRARGVVAQQAQHLNWGGGRDLKSRAVNREPWE